MKGIFTRADGTRRRPSAGLIVGFIALFIAIGGTAGALTGQRTVFADDLRTGSVAARAIASGAVHDTELGNIVYREDVNSINDGASGRAEVECADGEQLISGGGDVQQSAQDVVFHGAQAINQVSNPPAVGSDDAVGWEAHATNEAGGLTTPIDLRAFVLCLQ